MKPKNKSISEGLPQHIFQRVHEDIGQASMCWSKVEKAGIFNAKEAGNIALELCKFIAGELEKEGKRLKIEEILK